MAFLYSRYVSSRQKLVTLAALVLLLGFGCTILASPGLASHERPAKIPLLSLGTSGMMFFKNSARWSHFLRHMFNNVRQCENSQPFTYLSFDPEPYGVIPGFVRKGKSGTKDFIWEGVEIMMQSLVRFPKPTGYIRE
ncbi:hypothetical protein B0H19DRAFT_1181960 [Mycena capillaripes]|nr:hypothetical protein B0H19DRAFT_1181960 [Mycena capillaripes]